MYITLADFKKRVELSLCQPQASDDDVRSFCARALNGGVGVVCLNPVNIASAAKLLEGEEVEISGNVGFPFGSHLPEVKALEASRTVKQGATQIDMVINVGALKTKNDDLVYD
ncbi:MAG: 2-deoxyribose-5-phosphate aldolase, partial [candidate division Zixibacteria bacterium]|nr:2-deoxyribose-5-phosphate aldolase [candidate division Zixibacteria bacterium]